VRQRYFFFAAEIKTNFICFFTQKRGELKRQDRSEKKKRIYENVSPTAEVLLAHRHDKRMGWANGILFKIHARRRVEGY